MNGINTKYENDGFIFKLEYRGGLSVKFVAGTKQDFITQVFEPIEDGLFEGGFGENHRVISDFLRHPSN
jgi:hypothetical protein